MSNVDDRLKAYWRNVSNFHRTQDDIWLTFIEIQATESPGVTSRAAQRFVAHHNAEVFRDSS